MKVFEFFTGFITIFENPLVEWILGGILAALCAGIAYKIGGVLGYRGTIGKFLWLITALIVYAVIACIIRLILWLCSLPWWIWVIIGVIVAAIILTVILVKRREEKQNESDDQSEN